MTRMLRRLAAAAASVFTAAFVFAQDGFAQNYEIWALDQGTNIVHIYDAKLEPVARIDLGPRGVRVPHMIHFTSDHAYAFIASTASGDVTVIRTSDRQVLDVIKTGPRTHMAVVKPGDSGVIVDVIGAPNVKPDGKLVEILIDRANEKFTVGRTLLIGEDPMVKAAGAKFVDTRPICHAYTADGRHAYVTLGPELHEGGLVVVDMQRFAVVKAYTPDVLKVSCGTTLTPDSKRMIVNGGSHTVGVWYALDTATHNVVKEGSSRGHDAHGVWPTPNGREIWMVNRGSSDGIVIDAATLEIVADLKDVGKTPDIIAMSPDSRFAFVTLRGPKPKSMPHMAVGTTPGFAVMDIASRRVVRVIEPAKGDENSDFHGIGVRVIR